MFYFFLFGLAALGWLIQLNKAHPAEFQTAWTLGTYALYAAGAYFVFILIKNSNWRRQWKADRAERKRLRAVNRKFYQERWDEQDRVTAIKKAWGNQELPTPEQFEIDLRAEYTGDIHLEFQIVLINLQRYIYQSARTRLMEKDLPPSEAFAHYKNIYAACLKELDKFTSAAPPGLRGIPDTEGLFTRVQHLHDMVPGDYIEELLPAYRALAEPFRDLEQRWWLSSLPTSDQPNYPDYLANEPTIPKSTPIGVEAETIQRKERARRKYERDLKAWEKNRQTTIESQPPIERALYGTPYWGWADRLFIDELVAEPFSIPKERWFEGTWIVAPQGRGKTNLLRHLILHHLPDACVIIMDAKGDTIRAFERYAPIKDRLVYLNPSKEHPLALNPFDVGGGTDFIEYIFELLNSDLTQNHATLLALVLELCSHIKDANLETFRDILQNGWKQARYADAFKKLNKPDRDFFEKDWDNALYKPRRPELIARLRSIMKTPSLSGLLHSSTTKLTMEKWMDDGNVVLINNNYQDLGEKGCEFISRIFVALVWAAALKRVNRKDFKRPVYFVIDEADFAIPNDTKVRRIVQQCRSQKIAMIFAHQELQQIKNEDVKGALGNCAIKFANPNKEKFALAPLFSTKPEFFETLRQGQFAVHVLDKTPSAIKVSVPHHVASDLTGVMLDYPTMSEDEYQEMRQHSVDFYCDKPFRETQSLDTDEVDDF